MGVFKALCDIVKKKSLYKSNVFVVNVSNICNDDSMVCRVARTMEARPTDEMGDGWMA